MTRTPKYVGFEIELGAHYVRAAPRQDGLSPAETLCRAHERLFALPATNAGCAWGKNEFGTHLFRMYFDHSHAEISSPLAPDARSLVLWQRRASELALACKSCAETMSDPMCVHVATTSRSGKAWGFHLNALLSRETFDQWRDDNWQPLMPQWVPFLVTSPVLFGTGKVGGENGQSCAGFQLSQRADFVDKIVGLETVNSKSLTNERDEPLADQSRYARFHVTAAFDFNLMPFASWLKFGCVQVVLALLEARVELPDAQLRDPLASLRAVSRDWSLSKKLKLATGARRTAIEVQLELAHAANEALARGQIADEHVPDAGEVVRRWIQTLDQLRSRDPILLRRLDWMAKKRAVDHARCQIKCPWSDPRLTAIDLRFGELHGGIFETLTQHDLIDELKDFLPGRQTGTWPRCSPRDDVRRDLITKFAPKIAALDWDFACILVQNGQESSTFKLLLDDPLNASELQRAVAAASSVEELVLSLPERICRRATCTTAAGDLMGIGPKDT